MPLNGDIPYAKNKEQELPEIARNCLTAVKGGFIYDRELGSCMRDVDITSAGAAAVLTAMAREALAAVPQAEITDLSISDNTVIVTVRINDSDHIITIGGFV